jgi:hypothetical protein
LIPLENSALYKNLVIPVTEEELRRAEAEEGRYSTEQVLAHLRGVRNP